MSVTPKAGTVATGIAGSSDLPRGPLSAGEPEPESENPPDTHEAWASYRPGIAAAPKAAKGAPLVKRATLLPKAKAASTSDPWGGYQPITRAQSVSPAKGPPPES
eukprot:9774375-Prorocentrum_lima.AAC.1